MELLIKEENLANRGADRLGELQTMQEGRLSEREEARRLSIWAKTLHSNVTITLQDNNPGS